MLDQKVDDGRLATAPTTARSSTSNTSAQLRDAPIGFSSHAKWAIDGGLLRGYVHREERSVELRGRLRFGDQIAHGGGLPLPVEVSYDDFTQDILENRMLKTTATLL